MANPDLAKFAMSVSGWADDPVAVELLREGLGSSRHSVRNEAIASLVRRGDEEAVSILVEAMGTAAGAMKLRLAGGLALLSREEGREMLVDNYLGADMEKKPEPTARAIAALAVLDPQAAQPFAADRMKLGTDERKALYPELTGIEQPWARELVVEHIGSDKDQILDLAIAALASHGNPDDAARLIPYAQQPGSAKAALDALGRVGGDEAVSFLRKSMERETNPVFRLHAAASLWRLGERETAREHVEGIANTTDPETKAFQKELAEALDGIDDPETIDILITLYRAADDADKLAVLSVLKDGSGDQIVALMSAVLDERSGGNTMSDYILACYAIETLVREAPSDELLDRLQLIRGNAEAMPYTRISAAAAEVTLVASPSGA
jgi:HEAT repeat protein